MRVSVEPAALLLGLLVGFIAGLWIANTISLFAFALVGTLGTIAAHWLDTQ